MSIAQDQEQPLKPVAQLSHRYEGIAKVTGKARYAAEFSDPFSKTDLVYAYLVQATIPSGSVKTIDATSANRAPGVLAIITPFNAPKLSQGPPARRSLTLLQDTAVAYNGQPIAVVVAKTLNQAKAAAAMLTISYTPQPAKLQWEKRLGEARWPGNPGNEPAGNHRGDIDAAFAKAAFTIDDTYITPIQFHNPMETHATIAWWEGDKRCNTIYLRREDVPCEVAQHPCRQRPCDRSTRRWRLRFERFHVVACAAVRNGFKSRKSPREAFARP
jgi:xanthine dehydrogenase YagR molybdenum-binding subunit